MKLSFHILIIVITLIIFRLSASAQVGKELDLINDNIESLLPPLETIIDSAIANNPYVKFRDLQIRINEYKLKADRKLWTRNLGIQTDARFGTFDNFSLNTSEGQTPYLIATRSNQFNYGVGAYLKLPLFDLVNRKNQIRSTKAEIEQAQSYSQVQRNEVRLMVLKQYNDLIVKQKVLKIKSKYAETSKLNMVMVEKEFTNGSTSVNEYSRITQIYFAAESDFESSRMDLLNAYMILEEIVGIRFNLGQKK